MRAAGRWGLGAQFLAPRGARSAEPFLPVISVPYCARVTEIDSSPLVLYGRRRSAVRLRAGVLLWDQERTRRRIPVAAVERVEVGGPKGQELTVVLTASDATAAPAVTYVLRARSAPMVREFAAAVSRALPVRDAEEPRPDGAGLVTEEVAKRWRPTPAQWLAAGLLVAYALVALGLWSAGRVAPMVLWLTGPVVGLIGVGLVTGGWEVRGRASALRDRGITVEGRLERSYEEESSGDETVTKYVYSFVDTRGGTHERHGTQGRGRELVEIVYDSEDPDNNKVGRRTAAPLARGWALVLVGAPVAVAGPVFMVAGVVGLFWWPGGE